MGNIIIHKGLLLDERDFGDALHPTMETLSAAIEGYLLNEFQSEDEDEDELPELELVGLGSERFGTIHMFGQGYGQPRGIWLKPGGDFRSALQEAFSHLDLPEPEALFQGDESAIKTLELHLRREICDRVMEGDYDDATHLISAIANLHKSGLPHIRPIWEFERNGAEDLFDFRKINHGSGGRILAEIAFDWGQ